jgi:hypothetical protein
MAMHSPALGGASGAMGYGCSLAGLQRGVGGRGARDPLSVDPEHHLSARPVQILFAFGPDARANRRPSLQLLVGFRCLAARAVDHENWKLH